MVATNAKHLRRVVTSAVLVCTLVAAPGCASDDDDSSGAGAGRGGSSSTTAATEICDTYCARAVQVCTMTKEGCLSACKTALNGACQVEQRALYECWATAELTCSQFNVASSTSCLDLSANAGECAMK